MDQPTLELPHRNRMPIQRICDSAAERGVAMGQVALSHAVDHSRLFTSHALAPLWHAPIFAELTPPQQLRYNQLVGLLHNEIIGFFEEEFAGGVLPALIDKPAGMPRELCDALRQFLEEERQHTRMFRRLNQLAEPRWYSKSDYHILQLPGPFLSAIRFMARRPLAFPMVFWVMLLMEERSLMISRCYAQMDEALLDPQFAATYRAHAEDEARHVQLDWHLLERFYQSRPAWLRWINAKLLHGFIAAFFLKPRRANVRLVQLLIEDFPELEKLRPRLRRAVHDLAGNSGYRRMMYSPESTPIAWALLERLPEFSGLRRMLAQETF